MVLEVGTEGPRDKGGETNGHYPEHHVWSLARELSGQKRSKRPLRLSFILETYWIQEKAQCNNLEALGKVPGLQGYSYDLQNVTETHIISSCAISLIKIFEIIGPRRLFFS